MNNSCIPSSPDLIGYLKYCGMLDSLLVSLYATLEYDKVEEVSLTTMSTRWLLVQSVEYTIL